MNIKSRFGAILTGFQNLFKLPVVVVVVVKDFDVNFKIYILSMQHAGV